MGRVDLGHNRRIMKSISTSADFVGIPTLTIPSVIPKVHFKAMADVPDFYPTVGIVLIGLITCARWQCSHFTLSAQSRINRLVAHAPPANHRLLARSANNPLSAAYVSSESVNRSTCATRTHYFKNNTLPAQPASAIFKNDTLPAQPAPTISRTTLSSATLRHFFKTILYVLNSHAYFRYDTLPLAPTH